MSRALTTLSISMTAAGALLVLTTSSHAGLSVGPAVNVPVGSQPSGVTAGDFDEDGDVDLASTTDAPDRITLLINDGNGNYSTLPSTLLPNSSSPSDLIAGDLNGDNHMDLAVTVRDSASCTDGAVLIYLGAGTGSFTLSGTVCVDQRPRGLSIGDLDGDLDLDLALVNRDSATASVLTNNGSGSFTVAGITIAGEPRATAMIDVDGVGGLEVAVTNHDLRAVEIYTNAAGPWTILTSLPVGPFVRPDGVIAADLDGNGTMDIATATSDQTLAINEAAVFLNTGGVFAGPAAYATGGTNTSNIRAVDLDCDGDPDLVTVNQDSNDISMLLNSGAGTFGAASTMAVGLTPGAITSADMDGDGDSDLAVEARDSNAISVLQNDTCIPVDPCPTDTDGNGATDVDDLTAVILDWGTDGSANGGDVDGSGLVDVDDLTAIILAWGLCP